jgi:hypothetical protein
MRVLKEHPRFITIGTKRARHGGNPEALVALPAFDLIGDSAVFENAIVAGEARCPTGTLDELSLHLQEGIGEFASAFALFAQQLNPIARWVHPFQDLDSLLVATVHGSFTPSRSADHRNPFPDWQCCC